MEFYPLFYWWVPVYMRYFVLTVLLFVSLCANGVFLGITQDMYSGSGEYIEPFTMAYNAMYIGMGIGMMFYTRLGSRFTNKTLVFSGLVFLLLMNVICATATNPQLVIAACFTLGFTKVFALGEVYLGWLKIWSQRLETAKFYPLLFFIALGGLYFMTWLTAFIAYTFAWQFAYIAIGLMLLVSMILVLIFVENHPLKRAIPLYQSDLPGMLLLAATLMLINYVVVYGKVEDWFGSDTIVASFFGATICLILFVRRELSVKRPFFNFELFKRPNFGIGLVYFTLMGVFTPTVFQSTFSGTILHFESIANSEVNLYLIPGIASGCFVSFFWYRAKFDGELLMIIGFAAFEIYHIVMYRSFSNDFSTEEFWLPSILKGAGFALLFISIGLYTTNKFPFPIVLKVSGFIIIVRSFLSSGVFSGIYNYIFYEERIRHLSYLASQTDANEQMMKQKGFADFYANIQAQATLTASKELTGNIIIFGIVLIAVLLLLNIRKKISQPVAAIS